MVHCRATRYNRKGGYAREMREAAGLPLHPATWHSANPFNWSTERDQFDQWNRERDQLAAAARAWRFYELEWFDDQGKAAGKDRPRYIALNWSTGEAVSFTSAGQVSGRYQGQGIDAEPDSMGYPRVTDRDWRAVERRNIAAAIGLEPLSKEPAELRSGSPCWVAKNNGWSAATITGRLAGGEYRVSYEGAEHKHQKGSNRDARELARRRPELKGKDKPSDC